MLRTGALVFTVVSAGTCLLAACGGGMRACNAADSAGLRISEVMVAPASGRAREQWIEVVNTGDRATGLDGLVVDILRGSLIASQTVHEGSEVGPGEHALLARSEVEGAAASGWFRALNLPHKAAMLRLRCGESVLDTMKYGTETITEPRAGRSLTRVGFTQAWCPSAGPTYDGTNIGTPGAPNTPCHQCKDDGPWRESKTPVAGDLVIQEIHTEPPHAWLKLQVTGAEPVDLNGTVLEVTADRGVSRKYQVQSDACLRVSPGATVVLGVAPTPEAFPAELQALTVLVGPKLPRGPGWLTLRAAAGVGGAGGAGSKPIAAAKVP